MNGLNEEKNIRIINQKKPKTKKSDYKVDWKSVEFLDNYLKDRENL
jgi:hypothetical protein